MIIDISNTLPQIHFEEMNKVDLQNKEEVAFQLPRWASLVGWTQEQLNYNLSQYSLQEVVDELLQILRMTYSFDNFRILLNERRIKYHAIHLIDTNNDISEEATKHAQVSRVLKTNPNEFIGFAAYNPDDSSKSMRIVRNAITMQGFKGVRINPAKHGVQADHRMYYPLYSLCEEFNIPVWVQSSINFENESSAFIGHPKFLERPLIDFPNLKIIAGHGGWPWLEEMVVLLLKYKNLYVDTSAYTTNPQIHNCSGWNMFIAYADHHLQDQILFGSEWLQLGQPIQNCLDEINNWPVNYETKEKIFWKNAAALFELNV